ncbi:MAG: hypothetical protein LBJ25_08065 [Candidatus Margulisbacteria bacterium]|jgi:hypothetical protein|nr:hypothetical protein [Candidatus Margulisiibacteriota bacterium]
MWRYLTLLLTVCACCLALSGEISDFVLVNYDDLIADSYEAISPYIDWLSGLLSAETGVEPEVFSAELYQPEFAAEALPENYLRKLEEKAGALSPNAAAL